MLLVDVRPLLEQALQRRLLARRGSFVKNLRFPLGGGKIGGGNFRLSKATVVADDRTEPIVIFAQPIVRFAMEIRGAYRHILSLS